ncbi:hypothetical protein [Virgibacillus salexigens]|nr:hypothetical protein [Virgibacillus salexigens]
MEKKLHRFVMKANIIDQRSRHLQWAGEDKVLMSYLWGNGT